MDIWGWRGFCEFCVGGDINGCWEDDDFCWGGNDGFVIAWAVFPTGEFISSSNTLSGNDSDGTKPAPIKKPQKSLAAALSASFLFWANPFDV